MNERAAQRSARTVLDWIADDRRLVAATLVAVDGSAPLELGATMYVSDAGDVEGSITGGCVEAALVDEAHRSLDDGRSPLMLRYGVSDELAGSVGLTCGGTVHVLLRTLDGEDRELLAATLRAVVAGRSAALAVVLDGPHAGASLYVDERDQRGDVEALPLLARNVGRDARGLLAQGRSVLRRYGADGATADAGVRVHVTVHAPAPRMLIIGAIDFSAALARVARPLGYQVTIADPRTTFLRSSRFSDVAETLDAWPAEAIASRRLTARDAVLVFSHDPKLDVPAVLAALASEAGYIGALGSRRTTRDRLERLRGAGATEADLGRLHGPCGLDLGGTTVEEAAVSVLAEIVAHRHGRRGAPLREAAGAIREDGRGDGGVTLVDRRAGLLR